MSTFEPQGGRIHDPKNTTNCPFGARMTDMSSQNRKAIESVNDEMSLELASIDELAGAIGSDHPIVVAQYANLASEATVLFESV